MALSRAQAAAEIAALYGSVMVAVGLTATDTTGNLKEPIDRAFRSLGVAYGSESSATLDAGDLEKFLAIGGYWTVDRALDAASGLADVAATTLGVSKRQSQIVDNLNKRLERLRQQAISFGFTDVVSAAMTTGAYGLDLIEPEATS